MKAKTAASTREAARRKNPAVFSLPAAMAILRETFPVMKQRDFSEKAREEFAQSGAAAVASTRAATLDFGVAMAAPVTRILTLHPGGLSDFMLSLPALHALRESFPGARFCGVMRPALASLLHDSPLLDDVLTRSPGKLSQQTALMLQVRAGHFDVAVALSTSRNTTMLAWSSGAATRVGFATAKMDALLTHRVEAAPPFGVESYLELARAVGCAAHRHDARGLLSLAPAAWQSAARILEKHGIGGDFLVAAPAGASSPSSAAPGENVLGHFAPSLRAHRRDAATQRFFIENETKTRAASSTENDERASLVSPENETRNLASDSRGDSDFGIADSSELDSDELGAAREYSHLALPLHAPDKNRIDDGEASGAAPHNVPTEAPHDALAEARRAGEWAWREAAQRFAPISSARKLKEWPAPHWARALDEVAPRLPILILGNALSPVAPLMQSPVLDLGGRLDLPTMAALCGAARLFLGTDSGLMHLAAAQETPVLALFGPTDWRRSAPRGASTRVLHGAIECAPCLRRDCLWHGENERACLTRLAPETVARAALEMLGL